MADSTLRSIENLQKRITDHSPGMKVVGSDLVSQCRPTSSTLTYSDFLAQKGYEGLSAQIGIDIPGKQLPGAPPANNTLEGTYQLDDTCQTAHRLLRQGQ
ncbi:hypothetical protein [Rhizobium croatiense]|uniref:Uncharacterized protein n=1 Tax=Rhizobium croatiense TaxID=2867516 RepID=A0ABS7LYM8_9HYPH|nr:hypothetical protein [Rhizobium croatiense]MBY4629955.1 hypothetical protein [Rhizobium croatiense]